MFCPNCGSIVSGNGNCPKCGHSMQDETVSGYDMPTQQQYGGFNQPGGYQTPVNNRPVSQGSPGSVLTFGILSLALFWTGILGLIFSIVGLTKSSNYINSYGNISGQVRTGRILSIFGLIGSILMLAAIIFAIVA